MMFAVSKNDCLENHMKLVLSTLICNFLNHLQFSNMSKIRGMGLIWALDAIKSIYLCSNLCT